MKYLKNISIICFLLTAAISTQAQHKPSKEETVAFINRTLQSTIGGKIFLLEATSMEQTFEYDKYSYTTSRLHDNGNRYDTKHDYSLIKWENLESIVKIESDEEKKLCVLVIKFSSKYKLEMMEFPALYLSELCFDIPKDKYESIKKACLRLAEIAKQENKDPFAN